MTTSHVFRDRDGAPVGPGDYEIVGTVVRVARVQRSNGFTIDRQDATVVHTVEPVDETEGDHASGARCVHYAEFIGKHGAESRSCLRAGFAGNRYEPMTDEDEVQYLRAALYEIRTAFNACFTPDFNGVDWRDGAAVQAFAARVQPTLIRATTKPQETVS